MLYNCICMKRNLANFITSLRILGTIVLIFLPTLSKQYLIMHVFTGITDALDGYVARKTNTVSSFGSKLDTASDLLFYSVMMFKLWDILHANLPNYVWALIYIVLVLRAIYYILVSVVFKTLSSKHSIMNKVVGFLMFMLPFVANNKLLLYYSFIILTIAYISLAYEIILVIKDRKIS